MVTVGLLLILVVLVGGAGGVGFVLGHFAGRRAAARESARGFPVAPPRERAP